MYITPTQNVQFKGYTRFLSCNSEGKAKRLSDCPFGTTSFGDTRGLTSMVKKFSFPNACVEETIGNLHDNRTYRVYVAEPNETVSDMIKLQHDYIVYDHEPEYPDIKENFYAESDNKKGFETMKGYLKRLEAAEIKKGEARTNSEVYLANLKDLRQRLFVTEECSKIYEEGNLLREQKSDYERKIQARITKIAEIEEALPKYIKDITRLHRIIDNHRRVLSKKEASLASSVKKKNSRRAKKTICYLDSLNKKIELTEQKIEHEKQALNKYTKKLEFIEDFVEKAPERIKLLRQEINLFTQKISEISTAAEPYIRKLCEVYAQNGIKIIKRV